MITHKGTTVLHTQRLTLRRFTMEDAQAMYDVWASDARVTRFLTWQPHASADVSRTLLADWCTAYDDDTFYHWAIEKDGQLIGDISVVRQSDTHEHAELGYCIGYDYWGCGYTTEAVEAVIGFLFEEVGFHRIAICHAAQNPASGRVATKCGMTCEGTERESFKSHDGTFLDIVHHAVLRQEWREK
jgi:ribosomal-protein-alanine N-acetyltransferase